MIARYKQELSVATAYGLLLAVLAIATPAFFHLQFRQTWVAAAPVLVAAIGMTLVILARHIDISIGSQFSVCAVIAGLLAKSGVPMPIVAIITLIAGAAMGALNGSLIAILGLPSIVVTLATMVIFGDSLRLVRQGEFVRGLPENFQWFGFGQTTGQRFLVGIAIFLFLLFAWAMRNLTAGRAVYATGSDPEAARLAGVQPKRVVLTVFVVMGMLVALAAMLSAAQFPQVDPNQGFGLELRVIAAVVVGGTAVSGGRGTLAGSLIGVALLGTIGSALVFLKTQPQWEKAIQGLIILAAVAMDRLFRRAS